MPDTTTSDRQHIADLVSKAKVAMLTTMTPEGRHVSRPMALQEAEFDGDLWFFASADSAKVHQIEAAPAVNVSFSDTGDHSWTSIAGTAHVVSDRAKAEQLYTKVLQAWFPQGLDTPGLTLIRVEAESAEYWEGPSSTASYVLQTLRAAVTRDADRDPVRNDTVDL
ncbi:pyridoxamine 5'-phosphate oxidase family protein [Modestobacter roseus]|uniref:General stress protein 26 n=1 Tax=Modestobacter roseus TaxID=1181884 RepID=A0A562IP01_9ACTN|nr:pyridoxamine 5'-phosphate oxidase family protein [Modestobacter roseus]MQA35357.1 pyridoxamine 5'-phosphate oxidase [Modestobacter roseus]TWH72576.1 general stress protein 26 [Modestobacter roseus]